MLVVYERGEDRVAFFENRVDSMLLLYFVHLSFDLGFACCLSFLILFSERVKAIIGDLTENVNAIDLFLSPSQILIFGQIGHQAIVQQSLREQTAYTVSLLDEWDESITDKLHF